MKIIRMLVILLMLLSCCAVPVSAMTSDTLALDDVIPSFGDTSPSSLPVKLEGDFNVSLHFRLTYQYEGSEKDGNAGWLGVCLYDRNVSDGMENRFSYQVQELLFGHANYGEHPPLDTELTLNIQRHKQKLRFSIFDGDGNTYAQHSMKLENKLDRIYLTLEARDYCAIVDITLTHNEKDPAFWEAGWFKDHLLLICIGIVPALLLLHFASKKAERNVLVSKNIGYDGKRAQLYNCWSGFFWTFGVLLVAGLLIPSVGNLWQEVLVGTVGFGLPESGKFLWWILLLICGALVVLYWLYVVSSCRCGVFGTTALMLLFGIVHFVVMFLIIILAIELSFVFLILLAVVGIVKEGGTDSSPAEANPKPSRLLDDDGKAYIVDQISDNGHGYIRDEQGNQIAVEEWNDSYFRDDAGKLYRKL